nr:SDR family NAD(P)-dependent oxidoreductase [Stenotrophomonas sp. PS02300]
MNLAGRTVIVTGASGGIGVALCHALVQAGASIMAVGRNRSRLTTLAAALPAGRVHTVVADLSAPLGRSHLIAAIGQANVSSRCWCWATPRARSVCLKTSTPMSWKNCCRPTWSARRC